MKSSDRYIAPNVWVSAQIYFGSKRRLGSSLTKGEYRARLSANAKLLSMALKEFRKYLNFSEDTTIRLASIRRSRVRGTAVKGLFNGETNIASIRYRIGFKGMLETLAHELVHGEQFHTGQLKYKWSDNKSKWVAYWCGSENDLTTEYAEYVKLPWEAEAFKRQEGLAAMVYLDILKQRRKLSDIEREVLQ